MQKLFHKLFRKKSLDELSVKNHSANTRECKQVLKKTLGLFDLVMIGIGCTIGTGIFVVTGTASAKFAGPAITISYILASFVCLFAALVYAEIASMVPISGSAYTYTYLVVGEFFAWLVGWFLILEYGVGAATVANGWSGYISGLMAAGGIEIPKVWRSSVFEGGIFNLPAVFITCFIGSLLYFGTKQGVGLNRFLVAVKLGVVAVFLWIATPMIKFQNYAEFMPFGWGGVFAGVAAIFYAYIGFDAVATTAEECKNPKRDLPLGIIISLAVCAVLYAAVSLVLNGIVHFSTLDNPEPLAMALRENGNNLGSILVGTGAVAGITSVLLVLLYGQSRIFYVMSRDGLMPPFLNKIHKKFQTPHLSVLTTTFLVATISGFFPLGALSEMTSIGTLFSFIVVAFAAMTLRKTHPNLRRTFKCPAIYLTGSLAIIACGYLIFELMTRNQIGCGLWLIAGIVAYFCYGIRKSSLNC